MRENLQKVLRKIVLPINDRLVDVMVSQMGMGEIYVITYIINDRIDYGDAYEIESETRSLFNMLSPNKHEDFFVQYKMVDDLK